MIIRPTKKFWTAQPKAAQGKKPDDYDLFYFFTTQEKTFKRLHSAMYALVTKTKSKKNKSQCPADAGLGALAIHLTRTQSRKTWAGGGDPTVAVHVA